VTELEIVHGCKKQDRKAQKALYDRYSAVMYGVCLRYMKNQADAEDILIEGLFKAMSKIDQFNEEGSFEGWVRRIVVNECLMALRKNNVLKFAEEIQPNLDHTEDLSVEDNLIAEDLLKLLDHLPNGYRTVFNLYVLEGYKHREIAEELGISINTSKSQLILARKRLEELYKNVQNQEQI
jgi:RNA polymerase sigma-70 factor (ECF subfamily)